jgi:putative MATE family efflux protein
LNNQSHFSIKSLLKFTFPSIIMMIFTSIYGVFDGLFISNVEGDTAFSAVNLILPYIMLLGTFGYMFGTGGSALIAKTYGEGDKERGNRYFTMIFETMVVIGILCTVIGFFTVKPVAALLGATDAMLPYCEEYGEILVLFIGFFMIQNAFQAFMAVAEKPHLEFIFIVAAGLVNIFGDYLLIAVFHVGVKGAAIATGASQVVGALLPIGYLVFFKNKTPLNFTKPCFEISKVLNAAGNGLSEMVSNVSMSLVNMLFNAQLMKYIGQDGVTAFGIIMYVGFIFTGVYFGYAIGVSPIISYHYGAKNEEELQSLLRKCLLIYCGFAIILASTAIALGTPLSMAFIRNNEELQLLCAHAIRLYSIAYYLSGFNIFASSFFTALNDGFVSGFLSLMRTFVFQIVSIFVLPLIFGVDGLWLAVLFSEFFALMVSAAFLFLKNKKYHYWKRKNSDSNK